MLVEHDQAGGQRIKRPFRVLETSVAGADIDKVAVHQRRSNWRHDPARHATFSPCHTATQCAGRNLAPPAADGLSHDGQIQAHHLRLRRHKIKAIALDGRRRADPEVIGVRRTADESPQLMPRLFIEAQQRGICGRIAGRADKDLALAHDRAAEGAVAELGDPFDVFRGGQIDFAMAVLLPERIPIRQPLLGFGGHIARRLSAPRRPISGTRGGCRDNQGQEKAAARYRNSRENPATIFLNPVASCESAFMDIFLFTSGVAPRPPD